MEALPTPTYTLHIGVIEDELITQFALNEVHFCPQQTQLSFGINVDTSPYREVTMVIDTYASTRKGRSLTILDYLLVKLSFALSVLKCVRETITAACANTNSKANLHPGTSCV